jgi:hypothetical protein
VAAIEVEAVSAATAVIVEGAIEVEGVISEDEEEETVDFVETEAADSVGTEAADSVETEEVGSVETEVEAVEAVEEAMVDRPVVANKASRFFRKLEGPYSCLLDLICL